MIDTPTNLFTRTKPHFATIFVRSVWLSLREYIGEHRDGLYICIAKDNSTSISQCRGLNLNVHPSAVCKSFTRRPKTTTSFLSFTCSWLHYTFNNILQRDHIHRRSSHMPLINYSHNPPIPHNGTYLCMKRVTLLPTIPVYSSKYIIFLWIESYIS